jgi:hypothetical protein
MPFSGFAVETDGAGAVWAMATNSSRRERECANRGYL